MNKMQLLKQLSAQTGLRVQDVRAVVNSLIDTTTQAMQQGDYLCLQSFGTFQPVKKAARPGRNPKTNEPAPISARTVVKFKMGTKLHQALNG